MPPRWFRKSRRYFKTGHKFHEPSLILANNSPSKNFERLPVETYNLGLEGQECPSILRPMPQDSDNGQSIISSPYIQSNRLVNMAKCADMMSTVYAAHFSHSRHCMCPDFQIPHATEKLQGLGTSVTVLCTKCDFTSDHCVLFNKVYSGLQGKPPAETNIRLGQYIASSECSLTSIRTMLAVLDCPTPAETTIQRQSKKASMAHELLGEVQLNRNQEVVAKLLSHKSSDDQVMGVVGIDTMYNNPSKGCATTQRGTQSSTPVVEFSTKRNLLIGMETYSQVCAKRRPGQLLCPNNRHHCTANYQVGGPMSMVEHDAAAAFYSKAQNGPLNGQITHLLSDGSNQSMNGMDDRNVERLLCVQHLKRGQVRKFYSLVPKLNPNQGY